MKEAPWDGGRIAATQCQAHSTAPTTSTAFATGTYKVRLVSTAGVWFKIGNSVTSVGPSSNDSYLPPNIVDYFNVTPGQTLAFSSTSTSTGYLVITEII